MLPEHAINLNPGDAVHHSDHGPATVVSVFPGPGSGNKITCRVVSIKCKDGTYVAARPESVEPCKSTRTRLESQSMALHAVTFPEFGEVAEANHNKDAKHHGRK